MGTLRKGGQVNLRVEGTAEVNSSSNLLELGEVNLLQLVVAGNLETTVDLGQSSHADVGELLVVHKDKVTSAGQVGGDEGLEVSAVEAESTGEGLQGRNGDAADVAAGQVLAGAEVGQLNLERVVVGSEGDIAGGVLQVVDVDGLQVAVVLDVESTNGIEGNTIEGAELGVSDVNIAGLGDTGVEGEGLQGGKDGELQGADGRELGEVQVGESGQADQLEGTGDLGDGVGSERGHLSDVVDSQVTLDLLDAGEAQFTGEVGGDGDITLDSGARGDSISVALGGDLGVTACENGLSQSQSVAMGESARYIMGYSHLAAKATWVAARAGSRYLAKTIVMYSGRRLELSGWNNWG